MNSTLTNPNATAGELIQATSGVSAGGGGGTISAFILASLGLFVVLAIVWYVLQVVAYWKIFAKAGEPGWKSIVPFYNLYTQYRLTWNTVFFWIDLVLCVVYGVAGQFDGLVAGLLSGLSALAAAVIYVMENYRLSRAFGHGVGYTIGLMVLNPIFKLILGFGKDAYVGNTGEAGE